MMITRSLISFVASYIDGDYGENDVMEIIVSAFTVDNHGIDNEDGFIQIVAADTVATAVNVDNVLLALLLVFIVME